jgi:CheY-like chemotaxis protein/HPt (histidine-containing phosphotransfer) domain-containing protein
MGLHADAVANGAEAVEAVERIPYDLVLMDIQMPEMDGLEATRRIRALESEAKSSKLKGEGENSEGLSAFGFQLSAQSGRVPIVAMTAHAMQGDRERFLAAGMNGYIPKPVDPLSLAEELEKWLGEETGNSKLETGDPKLETGNAKLETGKENGEGCTQDQVSNSKFQALPAFDHRALLDRLMGDEDLARTIMEAFLNDIPTQIDQLNQFLSSGDVCAAERQAHTIKGAAANVGGEALRAVALEMEKAGKAGDLESAKSRMKDLHSAFDRLRCEMEKTS